MAKEPAKSFSLSDDRQLALYLLIRYSHATMDAGDLDEGDAGYTSEQLKSFLRRQKLGRGLQAIYDRYQPLFCNDEKFDTFPSYIREAVKTAYDYRPKGLLSVDGKIDDILDRIRAQHVDKAIAFSEQMPGLYLFYRYAAHIDEEFRVALERSEDTIGIQEKSHAAIGPRIVKACLQIFKRERGARFPRFQVHYQGGGKRPRSTAVGSVVLLDGGRHIMLFGEDKRTHFPLYMVANYDAESMDVFNGLVTRLHEKGMVFASRIHIRKTTIKVTEIDKHIGVFPMSDPRIQKELEGAWHMIANTILHKEHRTALHIFPS